MYVDLVHPRGLVFLAYRQKESIWSVYGSSPLEYDVKSANAFLAKYTSLIRCIVTDINCKAHVLATKSVRRAHNEHTQRSDDDKRKANAVSKTTDFHITPIRRTAVVLQLCVCNTMC